MHILGFWSRSFNTVCIPYTAEVPETESLTDASNVSRQPPRIKRHKDW